MLLDEHRLDALLAARNPWWGAAAWPGGRPAAGRLLRERPLEGALLDSAAAGLIVGPRRSGKTSVLHRMIDRRLAVANDVVYLPVDHPVLRLVPLGPLVDRALKASQFKSERPLVLIDGLQAIPDWPERWLELVRTRPRPRFLAASSVAPALEDPAFETHTLRPLSFREFCDWRGVPGLDATPLDLESPTIPERNDADDHLYQRVLDPLLADYLVRGGFPECLVETEDGQHALRENVVARAIYRDLPAVVGVQRVADVERVFLAALLLGGEPLHVEAFADAVELDRQTVGRYLDHLERVRLLTSLKNFAASTDRSRARVYPTDPGLVNALFERGIGVLADAVERRRLLLGAVVGQVAHSARERGLDVAYYREGDLEAEVVIVSPDGAVPVVVFDHDDIGDEEVAHVERLMKRTQARRAFLLSRGGPRRREAVTFFETIFHLPAAYFLYALES